MSADFYQKIKFTSIRRYKHGGDPQYAINLDSAWRVYRSSPERATLQVRGPELLSNNRPGVHGIIANATLDIADLVQLRNSIDKVIRDFPDYAKRKTA